MKNYVLLILLPVALGLNSCKILSGSGTVSSSSAVTSSDGGNGGTGGTALAAPVFSYPTVRRNVFITGDDGPFTVTFTNPDGAIAECQVGSGSFATCASSTSLIWLAADWNTSHTVRFTKDGVTSQASFTPSAQTTLRDPSAFSYVTCDATVTTSMNFTAFSSAMGMVTCVGNDSGGITIVNSGSESAIAVNANQVIISKIGQDVNFANARTTGNPANDSVFSLVFTSGATLAGLNIWTYGDLGYGVYDQFGTSDQILDCAIATGEVSSSGIALSATVSFHIDGTRILTLNDSAPAIDSNSNGNFDIQVRNSTLSTLGDFSYGIYVTIDSYASIYNTQIHTTGKSAAVYAFSIGGTVDGSMTAPNDTVGKVPTLDIRDSVLVVDNSANNSQVNGIIIDDLDPTDDASLHLKNSVVAMGSGNNSFAIQVGSFFGQVAGKTRVILDGTTFVRLDAFGTDNEVAIENIMTKSSSAISADIFQALVYGTTTPSMNYFCNERADLTGARFYDKFYSSGPGGDDYFYFDPAAQNGGLPIGQCSASVMSQVTAAKGI